MDRASMIASHLSCPSQRAPTSAKRWGNRPVKVVVTGAAGNIAYSVLFGIGRGKLLGPNVDIDLYLLDLPFMQKKVDGVIMELRDCAFPIITSITGTSDYGVAFQDAEVILAVGAKPRGKGMVRADLLKQNGAIFAGQGKAINTYASRNVKVVVVGNPANTNALILAENAPDIPRKNITALNRLDQNRAIGQIALKTGVASRSVRNLIVWGNHSKTQYPDVHHGHIVTNGSAIPIRSVVNDDDWLNSTFIPTVQKRGGAIIKARGASSAASAANATLDHVRDWFLGTPEGTYVSMAVPSDGSYGVPKNLVFSFPCTTSAGEYTIVQGLKFDADAQARVDATAQELATERDTALAGL